MVWSISNACPDSGRRTADSGKNPRHDLPAVHCLLSAVCCPDTASNTSSTLPQHFETEVPMDSLDARIASKHLLDHPFYQRWAAGTLTSEELREYARQYWHYALAFPTFVSGIHAHTDDLGVRQMLL